ncbi:hypothetical protein VKT23_008399 [Stygiomarasmius scandens]|uniref:Uncharacterized protein n=1 Tax=Marasmiellus scandens TaxID=2682957 RepID=A0ABR1JIP8_9AGAR
MALHYGLSEFLRWLDLSGISALKKEQRQKWKDGEATPGKRMDTLHLYAASILLDTLWQVPFEVVFIRLSLQYYRDQAAQLNPENNFSGQWRLRRYSAYAKVIGIRPESDPYTSLYDCVAKMIREEGWRVFYRGYWLTVLSRFSWMLFTMSFRLFKRQTESASDGGAATTS